MQMLFEGLAPPERSDLPTEDLIFDDVPVRVYWPQTSVVGRRRGMLYIHGGVGVLGSIRKLFSRNQHFGGKVVLKNGSVLHHRSPKIKTGKVCSKGNCRICVYHIYSSATGFH